MAGISLSVPLERARVTPVKRMTLPWRLEAALAGLLGAGCVVRSRHSAGAHWLWLTAALLALSLLVKPITIGIVLPIALALDTGHHARRRLLIVALVTALAVLCGVVIVGLPEIVQQIIQF